MRRCSLVLLLILGCSLPRSSSNPGTYEGLIRVGDLDRTYQLHLPPALPQDRPAALVLVLHGGGGWGRQMEPFTGFSELADREGFIACYPDGIEKNWNDGRAVNASRAHRDRIDDVGFIDALITQLSRAHKIDPKRVYATGISNGGFMSHTLGARLSTRIAAIAPVVGGMAPTIAADFKPERPVSVLILQGTADPLIPYEGGAVALTRGETVSTRTAVRKWVDHDSCKEPLIEELPDLDPDDSTRVKRSTYPGGRDGTEVVLYTIEGGGHTWPGGTQYLPALVVGRVSRDLHATQVIWDFFLSHPKP